jgi:cytoskeletal protein RodZ
VKTEVLQKYFEKKCSATEGAIVEQWLLDPQNQASFEQFLESYWESHANGQMEEVKKPVEKKHSGLRWYIPRVAAVAAMLALAVFSVYHFTKTNVGVGTEPDQTIAAVVVEPEHLPAGSRSDTFTSLSKGVDVTKPKTKQYGKKIPPKNAVIPAPVDVQDTIAAPVERPKSMKVTALTKVWINDSLIAKLSPADRITVVNQMAMNVNFNKANFRDIAVAFREKYGILLELCADAKPDKVLKEYTASFSKITLPDLIQDMSNHLLFSYTVSNNVVKICFN